jgi:hypothetical protein
LKQKLHILYSCNAWHEQTSYFLHGVFTTKEQAIDSLTGMLATAKVAPLSEDDHRNLEHFGQTQGYQGEGEFTIVEAPLDDIAVWL